MKNILITKFEVNEFADYKNERAEAGLDIKFTEYQIGNCLIKVINKAKDAFEEGLLPALLSIVNKDNNERCERLANPHELGIATDPVENMNGIDKVTVNGKEFVLERKQGSIHERLNMMDGKIETLRTERRLDFVPAKILVTLTPEEKRQMVDQAKRSIKIEKIDNYVEETTVESDPCDSIPGIYITSCNSCFNWFYTSIIPFIYCPFCSRRIVNKLKKKKL